jgi:hypothetical protein
MRETIGQKDRIKTKKETIGQSAPAGASPGLLALDLAWGLHYGTFRTSSFGYVHPQDPRIVAWGDVAWLRFGGRIHRRVN